MSLPAAVAAADGGGGGGGQQPRHQQQGGFGHSITGIIRTPCSGTSLPNSSLQKSMPTLLTSSPISSRRANPWICGYIFLNTKGSMTLGTRLLLFGMKRIFHMPLGVLKALALKNNGSLYAHVFFARSGYPPDPNDPEYQPQAAFGRTHSLVAYLPKSRSDKRKSLLGNSKDAEGSEPVAMVADDAEAESKDDGPVEWIVYWKPNITINLVEDFTR
ncbi:hypothetical protein V6N11_044319 [Hibiscus sabdariffa]|uniref:Uncharacterized protein n=1 Tax=Hibiscus sabdariffa TaxID=183260 RepID=A0ABR2RFE7_9ROSI